MAQYDNLKDYFQHEHIKLIKDAVSNHLKDDSQITEAVIRSLVCTADDAKYNTEFDLGVSVKTVGVEESVTLSFIVTVRGNLEQRFGDIKVVRVRRVTNDMFPKDNILSQFILPDIPEGEVERIGSNLYKFYSKDNIFEDASISIERLVSKEMLYFSPLPDNCLGRIILSEADVEVIHNVETEYGIAPRKETILAPFGTILLNYNRYAVGLDGTLRVTVAHELVHFQFHNRFLKLLQLLGEEKVDMLSSAATDTLTDIQQALYIAEWQADVIAMPLAIPALTVDAAIQEIADDPSTHYENHGDRMQACVIKFAKLYGVSPYVAKERLRQLGYDNVDGTIIEFDGDKKKPFTFPRGTLKGNETFVINRDNYERLLRKSKDFSELINSGRYIYLGCVVCLVDQKYVDVIINEDGLGFHLTTYAREHADECCIKFAVKSVYNKCEKYINYGQTYLSSNKNELLQEYEACISDNLKETINSFAKEDSRLNSTLPYGDALAYYLFEDNKETAVQVKGKNGDFSYAANRIIDDYAERTGLSSTMIKNYLNNCSTPKLKTAMHICHKLGLNETQSREMLKSAGHYIDAPIPENKVCRLIFRLPYKQAATILENWEACVNHFKETTPESTSLSKL